LENNVLALCKQVTKVLSKGLESKLWRVKEVLNKRTRFKGKRGKIKEHFGNERYIFISSKQIRG